MMILNEERLKAFALVTKQLAIEGCVEDIFASSCRIVDHSDIVTHALTDYSSGERQMMAESIVGFVFGDGEIDPPIRVMVYERFHELVGLEIEINQFAQMFSLDFLFQCRATNRIDPSQSDFVDWLVAILFRYRFCGRLGQGGVASEVVRFSDAAINQRILSGEPCKLTDALVRALYSCETDD